MSKILKDFLNWLKPKSPCHNKPMDNVDCHDTWGDMPIYECPECNEEWI